MLNNNSHQKSWNFFQDFLEIWSKYDNIAKKINFKSQFTTTYSVLLSVSAFGIGRYQKLYICILLVLPIRKLYLSAHICIGRYEKMLIVCSLPNAIINNALWEKADLYTCYLCTIGFFSEFFWTQNKRIMYFEYILVSKSWNLPLWKPLLPVPMPYQIAA